MVDEFSGLSVEERGGPVHAAMHEAAEKTEANKGKTLKSEFAEQLEIGFWEGLRLRRNDIELTDIRTPEQIQAAMQTVLNPIRESMRAAPTEAARYDILEKTLKSSGQGDLLKALNQDGEAFADLRGALGNAFAYNDDFAKFVTEQMTAGGSENDLAGMLQNLKAQSAGPLSGILNTLANNPSMTTDALEGVIDAVSKHTELTKELAGIPESDAAARAAKSKEIAEATTEMYEAIRNAGGKLPALTEMSGPVMMQFMMDLLNGNGTETALANLGEALNLTPEQFQAMQELVGPMAGIIEFMIEPYAELYQKHGDAIMGSFAKIQNNVEILTVAEQEGFDKSAAKAGRQTAQADISSSAGVETAAGGTAADRLEADSAAANAPGAMQSGAQQTGRGYDPDQSNVVAFNNGAGGQASQTPQQSAAYAIPERAAAAPMMK